MGLQKRAHGLRGAGGFEEGLWEKLPVGGAHPQTLCSQFAKLPKCVSDKGCDTLVVDKPHQHVLGQRPHHDVPCAALCWSGQEPSHVDTSSSLCAKEVLNPSRRFTRPCWEASLLSNKFIFEVSMGSQGRVSEEGGRGLLDAGVATLRRFPRSWEWCTSKFVTCSFFDRLWARIVHCVLCLTPGMKARPASNNSTPATLEIIDPLRQLVSTH